MPASDQIEVQPLQTNFSGGIRSGVSTKGLGGPRETPKFVRDAINARWRPEMGFSIRGGSRDASSVALDQAPTSMGKHYGSSGNKLFVGTTDGIGGGRLYRLTTTGRTQQTMDSFTINGRKMSFTMANGLLVVTQQGASAPPQFYSLQNTSDTWLSLKLPAPASAPTVGTDQAGGSITPSVNYGYRVRWVYTNGCSIASPVSTAHAVVAASGNYTIRLTIPLPVSPRPDFIGWVLERNLEDGDAAEGPFYRVTQQLAAVTTWDDGAADSDLDYESDDSIHLEPPAMDGVIFHKDRLWGWKGNQVYYSQPVIGEESTGICNWTGDAIALDDDAGDVQGCAKQGDRLLFGKRRSLYVVEGYDVDSFRRRRIYSGVGFAGLRSHVSTGLQVFFYAGEGRAFVANGDAVRPVWATELRDQLKEMDPTYDADVLGVNYRGEQVLFWHRRNDSDSQQDVLGWDLLMGNAIRDRGLPAIDAVSQDGESDFGGADLLVADPVLRAPAQTTSPSTNPSFHVWRDGRGSAFQVFAQALDSAGAPLWAANGVQVSASLSAVLAQAPAVCGDGSGGIIVAYCDNRSGARVDIYAQRYNAAGVAQWAAGGVVIESASPGLFNSNTIGICPDGSGGAVIAWSDPRGTASQQFIYAQRVNSAGVVQWTANGVKVYDNTITAAGTVGTDNKISVVRGTGSTFFICSRTSPSHVVYQVLSSSGAAVGSLGNLVNADLPHAISDGSGGFLVVYYLSSNIRVRRIDSGGATTYDVSASSGTTVSFSVCPAIATSSGVVFVAWFTSTVGAAMIQSLDNNGSIRWVPGGVPLVSGTPGSLAYDILGVSDGAGGAVFAWNDHGLNMRLQRIGADGIAKWSAAGVVAATGLSNTEGILRNLCTDGAGGAIVTYQKPSDLYTSRVSAAGSVLWTTTTCNATGNQEQQAVAFTDTPESEYPPTAQPGYHVWSAFDGHTDFADSAGQNGVPIVVEVEPHGLTCGLPNHVKVFQRAEAYILKGNGGFSLSIIGDGSVATVSLEVESQAVQYNSGVKYNDGSKYKTTGEDTAFRGLPPTTRGRAPRVRFRGEFTDELEHGGWQLQGYAIPLRRMS